MAGEPAKSDRAKPLFCDECHATARLERAGETSYLRCACTHVEVEITADIPESWGA